MPAVRFTDIRRFDTIDSTNRYLLDEARAGAPAGVVAVAEHQSAGRGRLGREWVAPAGSNLLVSVLLRPPLPSDQRFLATVAVALAAVDAVVHTTGLALDVKWPNDLQAPDGRKVAGVLAEADVTGTGTERTGTGTDAPPPPVVVGIGINVNWPADDADLPPELVGVATSLRHQLGSPVDRVAVLDALLSAVGERVAALDSESDRTGLASELAARCTTLGTRVRVHLPGGSFEGTATGLSPTGHLLVDQDGVARTVVAGDVVHIRPGGGAPDAPGRQLPPGSISR